MLINRCLHKYCLQETNITIKAGIRIQQTYNADFILLLGNYAGRQYRKA